MNHIETIYGEIKRIGDGEFILVAPRDDPKGIGCALGVMPWDGRHTVIVTERLEAWGTDAWRDYWVMFPLEAGKLYPLAYYRCTARSAEWGEVRGGKPEDQEVIGSHHHCSGAPGRQRLLRISSTEDTIHIGWGDQTTSLRLHHTGRLVHYCEASVVKVKVTQGGRA